MCRRAAWMTLWHWLRACCCIAWMYRCVPAGKLLRHALQADRDAVRTLRVATAAGDNGGEGDRRVSALASRVDDFVRISCCVLLSQSPFVLRVQKQQLIIGEEAQTPFMGHTAESMRSCVRCVRRRTRRNHSRRRP